jgi:hypothetical protein
MPYKSQIYVTDAWNCDLGWEHGVSLGNLRQESPFSTSKSTVDKKGQNGLEHVTAKNSCMNFTVDKIFSAVLFVIQTQQ